MATSADLVGWLPYFEETIGYYTARWHYLEPPMEEGQLIGRSDPAAEGTHCESLLRYHRPLSRNGAVEYEFFYDPGHVHTHPALDRLAFILDPDGVRVHWITDAEFDRTSVAPDNVFDEPENRRGSAWLPLRSKAWNHVRLQVEDQLVSLELNGQQVYERELETTNQRTFGLFHYVDQTEVRVRNLEMQGDWPTALPAPSEQQAAEQLTVWLDATRADFKSEFSHDFTTQGLPEDHFKVAADNGGLAVARPDGVHVQRPGLGRWSAVDIRLPFTVEGDFDIEASFEQFQGESDKDACIMLLALLNDQLQSQCRSMRIRTQAKRQQLHVSLSQMRADGNRSFGTTVQDSCEATAGRLRLSRRDKTVYWMFAENDSDVFQPIGSEIVSDAPVSPDGMQLRVLCNGTGGTSVVWKKVVLQAERLAWFPPNAAPEPRRLQVMNSDGSNLQVVMEVPEGFTQFGSPEWSADGKRIAFDASNGSTTTSHVMVVDADGNNLQDLGLGCMPGFSADGKRMVFSQPGQGVVMMDADGSNRQTIDQSGWGVQWSPDGKHIAYGNAGNITIMNLDTKEKRPLLVGEQASRYSYIYWNLAWSRDSRSVCAKARLRQTGAYEVMVADIDSPAGFQVLHSTSGSINADFTWDPDNRHVLFAMHNPAFKGPQLYLVSRDNPGRPELFPGQPTDRKIYDCAWSPDGQFIVFSGQQFPQPIDWTGNDTRAATDTNPLFRQLIFDIDN
jgi:Tol biopolymer transport system component